MKKSLAFSVIILFISASVIPSTGTPLEKSTTSSDGNTLYVGGSGEGNYTKIQDAIDDASDGDTVFVFNGTYYENVVVDKSINLIGEDRSTAIINSDSTGNTVDVTANCVKICGFMIINRYFYNSIRLYHSDGNEIFSNTITSNHRNIYLKQSNLNLIHNNTISIAEVGICLQKSNNNIICYNEIFEHSSPDYPYGEGIIIEESNFTNVAHNNFHDNDGGIFCIDSNENNIVQNTFSNNKWCIFLRDSDKNNIVQNMFSNNPGINPGIFLEGSDKNNIVQNTISNSSSMILDASYLNVINYNNLDMDTYISFEYRFSKIIFPNNWNRNYWGKPRILPKLIKGRVGILVFIPWFNFDWHPAREPYDIGV